MCEKMDGFKIFEDKKRHDYGQPHVVAMVGLPARGKTFISKKLSRYLNWIGIGTRVFNLGEYRRSATTAYKNHEFFSPDNKDAMAIRNKCASIALNDACSWLRSGAGLVAIFDATNTTIDRRQFIYDHVVTQNNFQLFFIESICSDPKIIEQNIMDVKVSSPDYKDMNAEIALQDFLHRIEHYKQRYQHLDDEVEGHLSFIRIYDRGRKVTMVNTKGYLQCQIVFYLMNICTLPRILYLTRHGESEDNVRGLIGGDSDLSPRGWDYAKALGNFVEHQNIDGLCIWTSCLKRSIQTAKYIKAPQKRWSALNEINAGICEVMSYKQIEERFPEEFAARDANKYLYQYPRGESYKDLVFRLKPVITEMERKGNTLIISHQAVLRCLMAYFLDKPLDELPYLHIPLHVVIKLTPFAYGCKVEYIKIPVEAVDTHRPKPPAKTEDKSLIT